MVLERLDGKDTAKHIERNSFHDIHYIREMLFSVFCALDISQKQLGFHHSDLRLANIMDIGPEPPSIGAGPSKARGQQPLTFPGAKAVKGEPGVSKENITSATWTIYHQGNLASNLGSSATPLTSLCTCSDGCQKEVQFLTGAAT